VLSLALPIILDAAFARPVLQKLARKKLQA
jgi:hypothetical protein